MQLKHVYETNKVTYIYLRLVHILPWYPTITISWYISIKENDTNFENVENVDACIFRKISLNLSAATTEKCQEFYL